MPFVDGHYSINFTRAKMAGIEREGQEIVYKQDDGEITAWLTNFEEKMELSHQANSFYKKVFFLTVFIGLLYLGAVFLYF
jgi:hypothetical protein